MDDDDLKESGYKRPQAYVRMDFWQMTINDLQASQAIRDGADYLVIGRPIIYSSDPASMARTVIEQMKLRAPNR